MEEGFRMTASGYWNQEDREGFFFWRILRGRFFSSMRSPASSFSEDAREERRGRRPTAFNMEAILPIDTPQSPFSTLDRVLSETPARSATTDCGSRRRRRAFRILAPSVSTASSTAMDGLITSILEWLISVNSHDYANYKPASGSRQVFGKYPEKAPFPAFRNVFWCVDEFHNTKYAMV